MESSLEIEVIYFDPDLIELLVHATNGRFTGTTELYVGHDQLPKIAESLRGFPSSATDRREFELGTFDSNYAGGGVRLLFWCRDSLGHAFVRVGVRADPCHHFAQPETADLVIPVEPYAIDQFVHHLARLEVARGASARLEGTLG